MQTNNNIDNKECLKKLRIYLDKYGKNYPDFALDYIINNFEFFLTEKVKPDIIKQIYAELGLVKDENNLYKGHLQLIRQLYSIDIDILEIGGGFFPMMSKYIDEQQQMMNLGTITVYDSNLVTTRLKNVTLRKELFDDNTLISKYKLMIGIMPCEATKLIIKRANEHNKDFYVALCGCTHFNQYEFPYMPTEQKWFDHVIQYAEHTLPDEKELVLKHLPESYNCNYPIICSKVKTR